MIKKIAAYSFIVLANIVLLAHAVIPHHHHNQLVCVEKTHCQDDIVAHRHNTPEHNHRHDGKGNSSACTFQQAIVLPSIQNKLETDIAECTNNLSQDYAYTLPCSGNETSITEFLPIASVPIAFSYSSYAITSLGLRAPPVV